MCPTLLSFRIKVMRKTFQRKTRGQTCSQGGNWSQTGTVTRSQRGRSLMTTFPVREEQTITFCCSRQVRVFSNHSWFFSRRDESEPQEQTGIRGSKVKCVQVKSVTNQHHFLFSHHDSGSLIFHIAQIQLGFIYNDLWIKEKVQADHTSVLTLIRAFAVQLYCSHVGSVS